MARTYRKLVIRETGDDFRSNVAVAEEPWREPGRGEVLVRNRWAGVNGVFDRNLCANRVRYVDAAPPFDLGVEAVGEVVALGPDVDWLRVGEAVATSRLGTGYREYQLADARRAFPVREASPEILTLIPTGISALVGLERVGEMRSGETVAVSAAAGGLGHVLVQLAKLAGNHVIALTGSPAKAEALRALGVDRVVEYRREDLREVLAREYPRGLDLAWDTVGGDVFDAFLDHLAMRGRLVISGHTSDFDRPEEAVPQPRIYRKLYWKSASVRAFQMPAFPEHFDDARERILALYYAGSLRVLVDPTPFVGLEAVPDAVEHLLAGRNLGKVVVRIP
jgi:NADPH-dependent curcumin reductase CurA